LNLNDVNLRIAFAHTLCSPPRAPPTPLLARLRLKSLRTSLVPWYVLFPVENIPAVVLSNNKRKINSVLQPTSRPTESPSNAPTHHPVPKPTGQPTTGLPTTHPTTGVPTHRPTNIPTTTGSPTHRPTSGSPTRRPTNIPTTSGSPTRRPTNIPTTTSSPTHRPTSLPTNRPVPTTRYPTVKPTSASPTTHAPTNVPTHHPSTFSPTHHQATNEPTSRPTPPTPPYNVLFLIADDFKPLLKTYNSPLIPAAYSAKLDKLARNGIAFMNAHTQMAFCAPSRASFLTSLRPDTLRIYELATNQLYQALKRWPSTGASGVAPLPQIFKQNGYLTYGICKIFHENEFALMQSSALWTTPVYTWLSNYARPPSFTTPYQGGYVFFRPL